MNGSKKLLMLIGICLALVTFGCTSKQAVRCTAPEDNPVQHYIGGMTALEQNRADEARSRFERALYCDENYAPAYAGLAIVGAIGAATLADPAALSVERAKVMDLARKASKRSSSNEERFDHALAIIRINTIMGGKDWLDNAEAAYRLGADLKVDESALVYYQGREAIDYYMGLAYKRAGAFQKAKESFSRVLTKKKGGKWAAAADRDWKRTDRIVRAVAGADAMTAGIAIKDFLTRSELAVLLAADLKIDTYFARKAKSIGARVALITIYPESTIGKLADLVVPIKAVTTKSDEDSGAKSIQPGGSMFEQSLLLFCDAMVIRIIEKKGIADSNSDLMKRHANLE